MDPSTTAARNSRSGSQHVHIDPGEIAAIALALEITADALLIDEAEGRRTARQLGLTTIGVAGILVRARMAGLGNVSERN